MGIDSRTTVNPFLVAGHVVSAPGAPGGGEVVAGGVDAGGAVVAVGVPEGTVGSETVAVAGGVVGKPAVPDVVATIGLLPFPFEAPIRIAPVAPATATTSPSSAGQTQSPG